MLIYCSMTKFSGWLAKILNERNLSASELARLSHKSPAVIGRILNDEREPAPETIKSICKGLGIPIEEGYRAAGLLPEEKPHSRLEEKALYLINSMETEEYQNRALSLLEYLKQEEEKELRSATKKTSPRPSQTG